MEFSPWALSTFFLLMHLFSTVLLEFFSLTSTKLKYLAKNSIALRGKFFNM